MAFFGVPEQFVRVAADKDPYTEQRSTGMIAIDHHNVVNGRGA
jgi:hypothetical protein